MLSSWDRDAFFDTSLMNLILSVLTLLRTDTSIDVQMFRATPSLYYAILCLEEIHTFSQTSRCSGIGEDPSI